MDYYLTYGLLVLLLALNLTLIYYLVLKKTTWNKEDYKKVNLPYLISYLKANNINDDAVELITFNSEVVTLLTKVKALEEREVRNYLNKHKSNFPFSTYQKKIGHLFKIEPEKDGINLSEINKVLIIKSKNILDELEDIDIENQLAVKELMASIFILFFSFWDYIQYIQNKEWTIHENKSGLEFLLNPGMEVNRFSGSENLLEYKKILLNVYKILKQMKQLPVESNLILGHKMI